MTKREERIETLKAAGIDTGKFLAMDVPEGATIIIATPDGGKTEYDRYGNKIEELLKKVKDTGFIKEDPHFRRWVMAQTFDILNSGWSYEKYIKYHKGGYYYQFEMTLRELEAIAKMTPGSEARKIREKFFTPQIVVGLCDDYLKHLHEYVDARPEHNCKGQPYKKISGYGDVFLKNIEGIVFAPLEDALLTMIRSCAWRKPDKGLAKYFKEFIDHMVKFPDMWSLKLYTPWLAAYQGEGAYYTAVGLVKFHDCRVYEHGGYCSYGPATKRLNLEDSLKAIEDKAAHIERNRSWKNGSCDWYLLTGMLKQIIEDNHFDFKAKMKAIYN